MTATDVRLEIRRVSGRIGAEVIGVDPGGELDADTVVALRAALNEHKALVFDNVDLDETKQERFARYFGELTRAHPTIPALDGHPAILRVDSRKGRANHWHADVTFVLNPPQITTLRSVVIPPYGGETAIANAVAAYRDLPGPLRDFADNLWAVHTNDYEYLVPPESLDEEAIRRREQFVSTKFETAHPVVRVHPLTGERVLFVSNFAQRIVGLSVPDSRDVLRLFHKYLSKPENILTWRWSPNQLVIFDNRSTVHYAVDNWGDQPRRLHRITVAGEVPVGIDGRHSYSIRGDASPYTPLPDIPAAA
ncbi:MAG TPA: TauD/TfdA family dioxygenase [Pseudonocardiaceae bacterium]